MDTKEELTDISTLGEFGLIEHLTSFFQLKNPKTIKGPGDDAAVIDCGDMAGLITTDMYVEGVHFDLVYTPLRHLGYKCIAASVSDVYAMNGVAAQVLVSIGISSKFSVEAVEELYKGIRAACEFYGVDLAGGDTTSTKLGMIISVTAFGFAKKEEVVYRSGAKVNDILMVSGDLGGAYIGLQLLEREKRIFLEQPDAQPELKGFDYVLKRQLKPEARKDIVEKFKTAGIVPTSMIDVSDGLASEIMHICHESGTGCRLYEEKIPIDEGTYETALKFNIDPTLCALSGGEDYELLFTIQQADYEKLKNDPDLTAIGHITDKETGVNLITRSGGIHALIAQGWNHFATNHKQ